VSSCSSSFIFKHASSSILKIVSSSYNCNVVCFCFINMYKVVFFIICLKIENPTLFNINVHI
jgi:hypothetical protein